MASWLAGLALAVVGLGVGRGRVFDSGANKNILIYIYAQMQFESFRPYISMMGISGYSIFQLLTPPPELEMPKYLYEIEKATLAAPQRF